jgi:hypothetical protein
LQNAIRPADLPTPNTIRKPVVLNMPCPRLLSSVLRHRRIKADTASKRGQKPGRRYQTFVKIGL